LNVLFIVRSKSSHQEVSPFIHSQLISIREQGINVDYFTIKGRGYFAYINAARRLRQYVKTSNYDLIHAHYALCGWTAILAGVRIPVIVSLMGSDILGEYQGENRIRLKSRFVIFTTLILQYFVHAIIAKSENIYSRIRRKHISQILPNGVNLKIFKRDTSVNYRAKLGFKDHYKYILFLGNPDDKWKNIALARQAIKLVTCKNVELLVPYPVSHEVVNEYMNSSDILLVTSFMEGSSNIIKEAMACDCPIVTTNVGDAKWIIGNTEGCYVSLFDPEEIKQKIILALEFVDAKKRTNGRQRILELSLDSETVAKKIIKVYKAVLSGSELPVSI
jgi:teichuronic acid biosynthesis glycosyltransferase TuaC